MDEMKMMGGFTTRIMERVIENFISKKLNINNVVVDMDNFHVTSDPEFTEIKLSAGVRVKNSEVKNVLTKRHFW